VFLERILSNGSFTKVSLVKIFIIQLCLFDAIEIFEWQILWSEIPTGADLFRWRNESSQWKFHLKKSSKNLTIQIIIFWVVKIPLSETFHMREFVHVLHRRGKIRVSFFSSIWWEKQIFMENQIRKCFSDTQFDTNTVCINDLWFLYCFSFLGSDTTHIWVVFYTISNTPLVSK